MTKYEMKCRENFIRQIYEIVKDENLELDENEVITIINTLHRHNATLQNQYTYHCNGDRFYNEKKTTSLENKCQELADRIGLTLEINTDPRGYPLIFHHNSYEFRFAW